MKFQRIKDMVCGALIASMVFCSGTVAFAKVANMSIPVVYNNIKVIVNGKELSTSKEPFTYEGTTYLPIRAVAEAVGMDVNWDGTTKTVTLNNGNSGGQNTVSEKTSGTAIGTVIYKENGISVTYNGIVKSSSFLGGQEVKVMIENTSNKDMVVQVRDCSVNGFMIDPIFSCDIAAGKKAADSIKFMDSDLKENGITNIQDVEFKVYTSNKGDWSDYSTSKPVSIKN